MVPILELSLRQMAGRRRLVILVLLAALPVALTAISRALAGDIDDPASFVDVSVNGMLVAAILPIVTIALATAAFGNELEDRTLSYLVLKPIPRWSIVVPKILGSVLVASGIIVVTGAIVGALAFESGQAALALGVGLLAGVVAYCAIFTWAGLVTSRALGFALVYVFLWEGIISTFLSGVRYLSVRSYVLTLIHSIDGDTYATLGQFTIQLPAAIAGVIAVTIVFAALTIRRLSHMDVP